MKKIAVFAAATTLALALAGCGAPASTEATSASSQPASSAPAQSSEAASTSSAPAQQTAAISWTGVATADEAAKGAGFSKFGVFDKMTIDGMDYQNPTFAYANGVAQATYAQPANELVVRKADGKHETPLTDRDTTTFANAWEKSYEDLNVTMYGPAKGAATVMTWSDGTASYGVTYQGLGGEEMSLDADEVDAIVKAIKEANAADPAAASSAPAQAQEQQQEQASQQQNQDQNQQNQGGETANNLTEADVDQIIWNYGYGQVESKQKVLANDDVWYWQVQTRGSDGGLSTWMIGPDGVPQNIDVNGPGTAYEGNPLTTDEVSNFIWEAGLGDITGMMQVQGNDGVWYWQVTTKDANGQEHTYMVEPGGGITEV